MMDMFDKEFSELLQKSEFELPGSYEKRFQETIEEISKITKKRYFLLFNSKIAAVIALCVVSLSVSIGVGATINMYQKRMNSLSKKEVEKYNEDVQKSNVEADSYSRPLLKEEQERMVQLRDEYERSGKFPENEILQVDNENEVVRDSLCFCASNSTYYIPERTMTDEELLQIIDIMEKRDFSVQKENAAKETDEISSGSEIVTEKEAILIAKEVINTLYGMEDSDIKVEVEFEKTDEFSKYNVELTKKEWDFNYFVNIDSSTRSVDRVMAEHKTKETRVQGTAIKEKKYKKYISKIKSLYEKLCPDDEIKKIWMTYNYLEDGTLSRGNVKYIVETKDNTGYVFMYSVNTNIIYDLYPIFDMKNMKQGEKQIEKQNRKNGILKKSIVLFETE